MAEAGQEPSSRVCFSILLDLQSFFKWMCFCLCVVMRAGLTKSIFWVSGGRDFYYWENFLRMLVMFYKVTAGQFACLFRTFLNKMSFNGGRCRCVMYRAELSLWPFCLKQIILLFCGCCTFVCQNIINGLLELCPFLLLLCCFITEICGQYEEETLSGGPKKMSYCNILKCYYQLGLLRTIMSLLFPLKDITEQAFVINGL